MVLFIKVFVEDALDLCADVHLGEEVGGGGGVHTVGEEDVDEVVVGVDPAHGSSKAGVTEGVL